MVPPGIHNGSARQHLRAGQLPHGDGTAVRPFRVEGLLRLGPVVLAPCRGASLGDGRTCGSTNPRELYPSGCISLIAGADAAEEVGRPSSMVVRVKKRESNTRVVACGLGRGRLNPEPTSRSGILVRLPEDAAHGYARPLLLPGWRDPAQPAAG